MRDGRWIIFGFTSAGVMGDATVDGDAASVAMAALLSRRVESIYDMGGVIDPKAREI